MSSRHAFSDRVVLLTGASVGIGREMALQLAAERPKLVLAARDRAKLDEVAARCRELGAETLVVPTDVTDEAACRALVAAAVERFGAIDVLLLNAGQDMASRLDELTDFSILERLMRVNYLGCAWLALAALPHLVKSRGRFVVVSSLAGLTGVPTRAGYCATKHALHGFFDSLRAELAGGRSDRTDGRSARAPSASPRSCRRRRAPGPSSPRRDGASASSCSRRAAGSAATCGSWRRASSTASPSARWPAGTEVAGRPGSNSRWEKEVGRTDRAGASSTSVRGGGGMDRRRAPASALPPG